MSALRPRADMSGIKTDVRLVPEAVVGWPDARQCNQIGERF
jgi:hypothetical protein